VTSLIDWEDLAGEGMVSKTSAVFWNGRDRHEQVGVVNKRMGATLKWPPWSRV